MSVYAALGLNDMGKYVSFEYSLVYRTSSIKESGEADVFMGLPIGITLIPSLQ